MSQVNNIGTHKRVLSEGLLMRNIKSLALTVLRKPIGVIFVEKKKLFFSRINTKLSRNNAKLS